MKTRKPLAVSEPWRDTERMFDTRPTLTLTCQTIYVRDSRVAELSIRAKEVRARLAENEHLYDSQKITQQVYEKFFAEYQVKYIKIIDEYEEHCRQVGVADPGLLS